MMRFIRGLEVFFAAAAFLIVVGWTIYASIAIDSYHYVRYANGVATQWSETEWQHSPVGAIIGIVRISWLPAAGLGFALADAIWHRRDATYGILGVAILCTFVSLIGILSIGVVLAIPTLLLWASWWASRCWVYEEQDASVEA